MKKNKEFILTTLLCLLPIAAGVLLYSKLPDTIATHFDLSGEPNGWSSKAFAVFGLPALMAGMNLLCHFSLRTDPKRRNMNDALRTIGLWTAPVISILISAFIFASALGYTSRIELLVPLLTGLIFVVVGNYLPKTKQSYTMGIRLPWTLASEENWNRTHRLGGILYVIGGLLMIVITLLKLWNSWLMVVIIVLLTIVPMLYSYSLYKKGI